MKNIFIILTVCLSILSIIIFSCNLSNFGIKYNFDLRIIGNGTITIDPDKDFYNPFEKVTLTAINKSNSYFHHWLGYNKSENNIIKVALTNFNETTIRLNAVFYDLSHDIYSEFYYANNFGDNTDSIMFCSIQNNSDNSIDLLSLEIKDESNDSVIIINNPAQDINNTLEPNRTFYLNYIHSSIFDISTDEWKLFWDCSYDNRVFKVIGACKD